MDDPDNALSSRPGRKNILKFQTTAQHWPDLLSILKKDKVRTSFFPWKGLRKAMNKHTKETETETG